MTITARDWNRSRRHTLLVRLLRVALPVASIAIAIAQSLSAQKLPRLGNLDLGEVGVQDNALTMEHPRLSGYGDGGRTYSVTAEKAIQQISNPRVVELFEISGRMDERDGDWAKITADGGVFDADAETLQLQGNIIVEGPDARRARLEAADIDLPERTIISERPVTLEMQGGRISADSFSLDGKAARVLFRGNVVMDLEPDQGPIAGQGNAAP